MRCRHFPSFLVATLSLGAGVVTAQVIPNISEFQVNTETAYAQARPAVAALPNGTFVVVWESNDYVYPVGSRLVGQRYDADGTPIDGEFEVADILSYGMYNARPNVDATAGNNFVVVWERNDVYAGYSVLSKVFSSTGIPITSEAVVASATGQLNDPDVAVMSDGDFVVVWAKPYIGPAPDDLSLGTIYGHRFDPANNPLAIEFRVDGQFGQERQNTAPAITASPTGDFVVVWQSDPQSGVFEEGDVFARRFSDPITPQGDELQINAPNSGPQVLPDVTTLENGDFFRPRNCRTVSFTRV